MDNRLTTEEYHALLFLINSSWIYTQNNESIKDPIGFEKSIKKKIRSLRKEGKI